MAYVPWACRLSTFFRTWSAHNPTRRTSASDCCIETLLHLHMPDLGETSSCTEIAWLERCRVAVVCCMIIWKLGESVMRFVVGVDARITFAVAANSGGVRHQIEYSISPWNARIQLYTCRKKVRLCGGITQRDWYG